MEMARTDCGLTMISPTSFYSGEREKTKLNWFTYELAMSIYDEARRDLGRRLRREGVGGDALAEMSIHAARGLRDQVRQRLAGRLDEVIISPELVQDRHPGLSDRTLDGMVDAMMRAWDGLLSVCETCPTRCITEHDRHCTMFDEDFFGDEGGDGGRQPADPGVPARADPGALRGVIRDGRTELVHDEALGRLMDRTEKWCARFSGSRHFAGLSPGERDEAESVVTFFARFVYTDLGLMPGEWNGDAVEEGCLEVLPRRVSAEPAYFGTVAPVMAAFLRFAGEEGLVPGGDALAARVAPLGERIVANASDPYRWGPAKSLVMAAIEAGVDPADAMAMKRFARQHRGGRPRRRRGGRRR